MKKLMLILAIAIMATPAMATITFTAEDLGGGLLRIAYTSDDPTNDKPRGVALEIELTGGDATVDNTSANSSSVDPAYNCFIDSAWDMENTTPDSYNVGDGIPLAKADEAGPLDGTPVSKFAISMGVLDQTYNQLPGPSSTTNLITIQLYGTGTCDVTIIGDTTRGPNSGVVGSTIPSNLYDEGTQTVTPLVLPEMAFSNRPDCDGDFAGGGTINSGDITLIISYWLNNKNFLGHAPIGVHGVNGYYDGFDIDCSGKVNSTDITPMISYWLNNKNFLGHAPCPSNISSCY